VVRWGPRSLCHCRSNETLLGSTQISPTAQAQSSWALVMASNLCFLPQLQGSNAEGSPTPLSLPQHTDCLPLPAIWHKFMLWGHPPVLLTAPQWTPLLCSLYQINNVHIVTSFSVPLWRRLNNAPPKSFPKKLCNTLPGKRLYKWD
jgi:hypothetical protein